MWYCTDANVNDGYILLIYKKLHILQLFLFVKLRQNQYNSR